MGSAKIDLAAAISGKSRFQTNERSIVAHPVDLPLAREREKQAEIVQMLVLLGVQMGQTIAYQLLYTADLRVEFRFQLAPGNRSFAQQRQKIAAVKKSLV